MLNPRDERIVFRWTAADADRVAGRRLTDAELDLVAKALDNSTANEVFGDVVCSVTSRGGGHMTTEYGLFSDEGLVEGGFYSEEEAEAALTQRYSEEDERRTRMKCKYCRRKVVLQDFGHDCYMGDCDCGAHVEVVSDPQDGSESVSWFPPGHSEGDDDGN